MKKLLLLVTWCLFGAVSVNAQAKPFEGEIITESFVQYDGDQQSANVLGNGVHRDRAVVKKCKAHSVDEIGDIHVVKDDCEGVCIQYIPAIKRGMDTGGLVEKFSKDSKITSNIQKKPVQKVILGHNCSLYEGTITTTTYSKGETLGEKYEIVVNQTHAIKAYVAEDMVAPEAMKKLIPGFEVDGMVLQWRIKSIIGAEGDKDSGDYAEYDVTELIPRQVEDSEFDIPKGIQTIKMDIPDEVNGVGDVENMLKFAAELEKYMKELEKRKVGAENSMKTTGVHYKTEGEWDF